PLAYRLGRGRLLGWSLVLLPLVLVGYSGSRRPWQGAAAIFIVGLVYVGVLSGLSTLGQLPAPEAVRGRVLAFFLVALGVAYPIGSLVQGPVIDRIGIGWTTAGAAALLSLVMAVVAVGRRGIARAITGASDEDPVGAGSLSFAERIRPAHHRAISGHQDPGHAGQAPDQQGRPAWALARAPQVRTRPRARGASARSAGGSTGARGARARRGQALEGRTPCRRPPARVAGPPRAARGGRAGPAAAAPRPRAAARQGTARAPPGSRRSRWPRARLPGAPACPGICGSRRRRPARREVCRSGAARR